MRNKIAYLMICYHAPEVIAHEVKKITGEYSENPPHFFIHMNKASNVEYLNYLKKELEGMQNVHIYSKWWTYHSTQTIVKTRIFLAKQAIKTGIKFDYVVNLTGTHYLAYDSKYFDEFLTQNYGKTFTSQEIMYPYQLINHGQDHEFSKMLFKFHFNWMPSPGIHGRNRVNFKQKLHVFFWNRILIRFQPRFIVDGAYHFKPKTFPLVTRGYPFNVIYFEDFKRIVKDKKTKKFLRECNFIDSPCEVFWNTLLINNLQYEKLIKDEQLEYAIFGDQPSPKILTDNEIKHFFKVNKKKFFIRKIEDVDHAKLVDKLGKIKSN